MLGTDIGIDLGTSTTLIHVKGHGVVLREPSAVAIDRRTDRICAIGEEAYRMLGRTNPNLAVCFPLQQGVISDYTLAEEMITSFLKKICGYHIWKPSVVVCMPSIVTGVEQRALIKAIHGSGARKVCPLDEPIASALGAGIDISTARGRMVVDIGGGTTDIAVISLYGISNATSVRLAGNDFNHAIIKYIRHRFGLLIGERMAEQLKMEAGCVRHLEEPKVALAKGRDILSGLPRSVEVTSDHLLEAMKEPLDIIMSSIKSILEDTPPELSGDIYQDGILISGGGAWLGGMAEWILEHTGCRAIIPEDPVECVALGTGKAFSCLDKLQGGLYQYRTIESAYDNPKEPE